MLTPVFIIAAVMLKLPAIPSLIGIFVLGIPFMALQDSSTKNVQKSFWDVHLHPKNLSGCTEGSGTLTSDLFPRDTCGAGGKDPRREGGVRC